MNSIHPRVVDGHTKYPKVNTCGKPKKGRDERVASAVQRHLDNHPNDSVSAKRLSKLTG